MAQTNFYAQTGNEQLKYFDSDRKGPNDARCIACNILEAATVLHSI